MIRKKIADAKKKGSSTANSDLKMIEDSLPSMLSSQTLSQRMLGEIKRHHRWLAVYFYYSDSFPRVLRVTSLVTNIVVMLFIQSLTYTLTNPDDGSCEALASRAACIEPRSSFATGENKCEWNGMECSFIQPTESIRIILFVAIFSAILSTPIALLSELIVCNILSATTAKKTHIKPHHRSAIVAETTTDGSKDNSLSKRSNGSALSTIFAAQAELKELSSEVANYRNSLTTQQQIEFDCKLRYWSYYTQK